jgi:ABC-type phosphate/phosphonate transport system substrate-binding protein
MPIKRRVLFPLVFLLLFSFLEGKPVRGAEKGAHDIFRVGFSSKVFTDVDIRDAQVAMDIWAREMNRIIGVETQARATIFTAYPVMVEAILRHEIDMIALPALDFLRFQGKIPCEPAFVSANQLGEKQERLLLARKDGGISRIDHLKGKTLTIPALWKDEISALWFETFLAREGLPDMKNFFGTIKEVNKASQGIMSVFFKQADAALVTRSVFELMTQLNPQIGEALSVVARSNPYLGYISCFHKNVDRNLRQFILERAVKLHDAPNLKQMFTLLQTDRIVHFRPDHLESLAELWKQSRNAEKKAAARR